MEPYDLIQMMPRRREYDEEDLPPERGHLTKKTTSSEDIDDETGEEKTPEVLTKWGAFKKNIYDGEKGTFLTKNKVSWISIFMGTFVILTVLGVIVYMHFETKRIGEEKRERQRQIEAVKKVENQTESTVENTMKNTTKNTTENTTENITENQTENPIGRKLMSIEEGEYDDDWNSEENILKTKLMFMSLEVIETENEDPYSLVKTVVVDAKFEEVPNKQFEADYNENDPQDVVDGLNTENCHSK